MHSKRAILHRRKIRSNRKRSQFNRIHLINLIRAGKHECCLNDYRRSRVISDTNEIITSISSSHPDGDDLRQPSDFRSLIQISNFTKKCNKTNKSEYKYI